MVGVAAGTVDCTSTLSNLLDFTVITLDGKYVLLGYSSADAWLGRNIPRQSVTLC